MLRSLYEALLEGLVLFVVLWVFASRPRPRMAVTGLYFSRVTALRVSWWSSFVFRMPTLAIWHGAG